MQVWRRPFLSETFPAGAAACSWALLKVHTRGCPGAPGQATAQSPVPFKATADPTIPGFTGAARLSHHHARLWHLLASRNYQHRREALIRPQSP